MTLTAPETTAEWTAEIVTTVTNFFKTAFTYVRDTEEDRAVILQAMNFVDLDDLKVTYARNPEVLFAVVKNRLREAKAEMFQDRQQHYWENRFYAEQEREIRVKLLHLEVFTYEDFQASVREAVEWANWTGKPTR